MIFILRFSMFFDYQSNIHQNRFNQIGDKICIYTSIPFSECTHISIIEVVNHNLNIEIYSSLVQILLTHSLVTISLYCIKLNYNGLLDIVEGKFQQQYIYTTDQDIQSGSQETVQKVQKSILTLLSYKIVHYHYPFSEVCIQLKLQHFKPTLYQRVQFKLIAMKSLAVESIDAPFLNLN
ncbi:unnamed protein product [Paramecium octaurelia]|uniref:Uncharacterized protein n=1 Tax=Paramecium octaurelia TaxID=43137 RepID=A0A8S1SVB4_PAROT|nr:unnamed protein product [Paramecium octaurelia]